MSELEVIKIELNNHGKPIASIQGTTSYYGISPNDTFYPQEEADKVIAEKNKEIEELKHQRDGAFGLTNSGLTLDDLSQIARKEIDRHKYKRCLAMAMWCWGVKELNRYGDQDYMDFAEKWRHRWLKIAEKFKEGSNGDRITPPAPRTR